MLGFAPLGGLPLGGSPSENGFASGALVTVAASLIAGAAETEAPPVFVFFGQPSTERVSINGKARGALLVVSARLIPGAAFGDAVTEKGRVLQSNVVALAGRASVDVSVNGPVIRSDVQVIPGAAEGFDGVSHDNEFLLLAA